MALILIIRVSHRSRSPQGGRPDEQIVAPQVWTLRSKRCSSLSAIDKSERNRRTNTIGNRTATGFYGKLLVGICDDATMMLHFASLCPRCACARARPTAMCSSEMFRPTRCASRSPSAPRRGPGAQAPKQLQSTRIEGVGDARSQVKHPLSAHGELSRQTCRSMPSVV